jgi:hypothetical protein
MFTRNVTMKLKANCAIEFTRLIENDILPILRKQQGFRDEITFVATERSEAMAISFWETKDNAEAYYRSTGYAEILKTLENVLEGAPTVETFVLAISTFHKHAATTA